MYQVLVIALFCFVKSRAKCFKKSDFPKYVREEIHGHVDFRFHRLPFGRIGDGEGKLCRLGMSAWFFATLCRVSILKETSEFDSV